MFWNDEKVIQVFDIHHAYRTAVKERHEAACPFTVFCCVGNLAEGVCAAQLSKRHRAAFAKSK